MSGSRTARSRSARSITTKAASSSSSSTCAATASRCTRSRSTSRPSREEAEIELALQYDDGYNENTFTFVNNINTHEGGTHLTGFKAALTRTLNDYARKNGVLKKELDALSGDDVREGLTCVLSVKVKEPQFEGQTKTKLGNSRSARRRRAGRQREAVGVPRGEPAGRARDHREVAPGRARAHGRTQGARAGAPQERARRQRAARQARGLLDHRSGAVRDLPGRG